MNYQETLIYLIENLPMFHRVGPAALKNNLDNTLWLDKTYGHPHQNYKTIHVAGTNGKGSVSHTLAAILQSAGYKTGLYTSPHLKDFRERIRVNGEMISEETVIEFVQSYIEQSKTSQIQASFFELATCMAFKYFSEMKVDVAVIEVGLGGRLDSTNIITPEFSVITNISFDHTAILGNTLEKIAFEKAGIIKKNIPVVIGETQPETEPVFHKIAAEKKAPIFFADQIITVQERINGQYSVSSASFTLPDQLELDLKGIYQQKNLATILAAIQIAKQKGFSIDDNAIRTGLKNVMSLTGIMGRWQEIRKNPRTICDTGHNEAGLRYVTEQLKKEPYKQLHIIFGMVNDKDIRSVLPLLPDDAIYYFTKASVERALDEKTLQETAALFHLKGETYSTVKEALETATSNAKEDDLIFVGGSTFVVAEVI
ncbi:MAG TPA: folylpolyglutamate synthase/dihydrofolate synthase family protein [Prolixibacteraceae bacterium]|nr:folylpolyglutamate synthase/dihydrofolate synthase family protein [Prolixibacteraceae bacterium]